MNLRIEDRSRVTVHGLYRIANGRERAAIIIDLSPKGCRMLERMYQLPVGADIMLTMGHISAFPARICWNEGSFYGVEFKRPLHRVVLEHLYRGGAPILRAPSGEEMAETGED